MQFAIPSINSSRYKALRHFIRAIEPFVPGTDSKIRYRRLSRIFRLLGGGAFVRARRFDGKEVVLPYTDFSRVLYGVDHKRFGQSNFYPIMHRHIRPGSCVIDIGAGMGDELLDASGLVGASGRVIAFEPDQISSSAIEQTLKINRVQNAELHRIAIGAVDGHMEVDGRIHPGSTRYTAEQSRDTVPIKRLDTIMSERGDDLMSSDQVSLLKIDADGFDLDILDGAQEFFNRNPRCKIIIEHLPAKNYSGKRGREVVKALKSEGFSVSAIQTSTVPLDSDEIIDNLYKHFDDPRHMISHDFLLSRD